jgi:hypothetical protein
MSKLAKMIGNISAGIASQQPLQAAAGSRAPYAMIQAQLQKYRTRHKEQSVV